MTLSSLLRCIFHFIIKLSLVNYTNNIVYFFRELDISLCWLNESI